jgi:hypothetical protein
MARRRTVLEIRDLKSEIRRKSEGRSPKAEERAKPIRFSDFGLPSGFGFRPSDFAVCALRHCCGLNITFIVFVLFRVSLGFMFS